MTMTINPINLSTPDDGLGDPLRTGGSKINSNFAEIANKAAEKTNVLELDNTSAFVPDNDYEPATKKYVDDNSGGGGGLGAGDGLTDDGTDMNIIAQAGGGLDVQADSIGIASQGVGGAMIGAGAGSVGDVLTLGASWALSWKTPSTGGMTKWIAKDDAGNLHDITDAMILGFDGQDGLICGLQSVSGTEKKLRIDIEPLGIQTASIANNAITEDKISGLSSGSDEYPVVSDGVGGLQYGTGKAATTHSQAIAGNALLKTFILGTIPTGKTPSCTVFKTVSSELIQVMMGKDAAGDYTAYLAIDAANELTINFFSPPASGEVYNVTIIY